MCNRQVRQDRGDRAKIIHLSEQAVDDHASAVRRAGGCGAARGAKGVGEVSQQHPVANVEDIGPQDAVGLGDGFLPRGCLVRNDRICRHRTHWLPLAVGRKRPEHREEPAEMRTFSIRGRRFARRLALFGDAVQGVHRVAARCHRRHQHIRCRGRAGDRRAARAFAVAAPPLIPRCLGRITLGRNAELGISLGLPMMPTRLLYSAPTRLTWLPP